MFSEHLSPEAKGQVWVNAIGGVCKGSVEPAAGSRLHA